MQGLGLGGLTPIGTCKGEKCRFICGTQAEPQHMPRSRGWKDITQTRSSNVLTVPAGTSPPGKRVERQYQAMTWAWARVTAETESGV